MARNSNEALWREEFERLGEMQVYDNVKQGAIYNDEAKRQAAFRWLGEVAAARRAREFAFLQLRSVDLLCGGGGRNRRRHWDHRDGTALARAVLRRSGPVDLSQFMEGGRLSKTKRC